MPNFDKAYPPAEAERGKFVQLTIDDLTTLGMDPVSATHSRGKFPILTYETNTSVGAINQTEYKQTDVANAGISTITFSQSCGLIEIQNTDSSNNIFISFNQPASYVALAANGIRIAADAFYSVERLVHTVYLGSDGAGTDARVAGHYRG